MSQSLIHRSNTPLATCAPTARNRSLLQQISSALTIARTRRVLAKLDADALADIGLTAQQAQQEANRPLWDAPSHWSA